MNEQRTHLVDEISQTASPMRRSYLKRGLRSAIMAVHVMEGAFVAAVAMLISLSLETASLGSNIALRITRFQFANLRGTDR